MTRNCTSVFRNGPLVYHHFGHPACMFKLCLMFSFLQFNKQGSHTSRHALVWYHISRNWFGKTLCSPFTTSSPPSTMRKCNPMGLIQTHPHPSSVFFSPSQKSPPSPARGLLGGGFKDVSFFTPYLGKWSNLTNIFHLAWNHQLGLVLSSFFTDHWCTSPATQERRVWITCTLAIHQWCTVTSRALLGKNGGFVVPPKKNNKKKP